MRAVRPLAIAWAALLLAACAGLRAPLEPPEVSLVGIRPQPGGSLEQRFQVELRVLNPNDHSLRIDGLDFTLEVNGSRLTRGLSNQRVTIPRLGDALVTVDATTTVFDLLRQVWGASEATSLDYDLWGRVFVAGSSRSLAFSQSGSFTPSRPRP